MISSVVPTKLPVTRAYKRSLDRPATPRVWFCVLLIWRTSAVDRTRAAHSASLGSGDPGGSVTKRPVGGLVVIGAAVVVVASVVVGAAVPVVAVVVVGAAVVVVVAGRVVVVAGLVALTASVVA